MPIRGDINYITFLNRFQDRSENGIAHNVLKNKEHRCFFSAKLLFTDFFSIIIVTYVTSFVVVKIFVLNRKRAIKKQHFQKICF